MDRDATAPAAVAASCKACLNASRCSWIEAITGPVGIPKATSAGSESCRRAFYGLRHGIRNPEGIEVPRMFGIAGARNDEDVRPSPTDLPDDIVDQSSRVNGDDDACGAAIKVRGRQSG